TGFLRTPDGKFTRIDIPGSCPGNSIPTGGINPAGAVAGQSFDPSCSVGHGYLRSPDGTITIFDAPGSTFTTPQAINPAGAITGFFFDAVGAHGFLRTPNGAITTIDVPGSTGTFASAINPENRITGSFSDAAGVTHGFLFIPKDSGMSVMTR